MPLAVVLPSKLLLDLDRSDRRRLDIASKMLGWCLLVCMDVDRLWQIVHGQPLCNKHIIP